MCNKKDVFDNECLNSKVSRDLSLRESLKKNINESNYKEFNLTKVEAQLINSYTALNSYWINSELRKYGYNNCICKNQVLNLLNSGLNKIPSFSENTVYRFEPDYINGTLSSKDWYRKKIGKIIKAPFFLSTTKKKIGEKEKLF